MKKENTEYLVNNFPFFDPAFIFGCEDGWFEIIKELCEKLKALKIGKYGYQGLKFTQVGEKCGNLRLYYSCIRLGEGTTNKIYSLMSEATQKSKTVCEKCGDENAILKNRGGCVRTLCDDCEKTKN